MSRNEKASPLTGSPRKLSVQCSQDFSKGFYNLTFREPNLLDTLDIRKSLSFLLK